MNGDKVKTTTKAVSKIPIRAKVTRLELEEEHKPIHRTKRLKSELKGSCKDHKMLGRAVVNGRSSAKSVGAKESKENLAPNRQRSELSSSGSVLPSKKPPSKSMSYMELKRMNKELSSQVQIIRDKAELSETQHMATISRLAQEIMEHKEKNAKLKSELEHYQGRLASRNSELKALEHSLEEIKFENERLATILEGAKVSAVTGSRIDKSRNFTKQQHKLEMEMESQNMELDGFISCLESTISRLQDQESHINRSKCGTTGDNLARSLSDLTTAH